jgi:hypothetical protein
MRLECDTAALVSTKNLVELQIITANASGCIESHHADELDGRNAQRREIIAN